MFVRDGEQRLALFAGEVTELASNDDPVHVHGHGEMLARGGAATVLRNAVAWLEGGHLRSGGQVGETVIGCLLTVRGVPSGLVKRSCPLAWRVSA